MTHSSPIHTKTNNETQDYSQIPEVEFFESPSEDLIQLEPHAHTFEEKIQLERPFFKKGNSQEYRTRLHIQPKLKIGQPNDPYEQEADRMADFVVRQISNGQIQAKKQTPKKKKTTLVQLKCKSCDSPQYASDSIERKLQQKKGQGSPLQPEIRTKMEDGFGVDFSNVRVHTDNEAVQLSQQLGARAFTYGKDIYFNRGEYQTSSAKGKHLLAHELTHVKQQTSMINKMIQRSCYDEYNMCISKCQRIIPETDKRKRALCYAKCSEELGKCRKENPDDELRRVPWYVWGLGILGAATLSVADGPLPFGEAAAASLLISLGIIESEDSQVTN